MIGCLTETTTCVVAKPLVLSNVEEKSAKLDYCHNYISSTFLKIQIKVRLEKNNLCVEKLLHVNIS